MQYKKSLTEEPLRSIYEVPLFTEHICTMGRQET